jgi:hypothetical protein
VLGYLEFDVTDVVALPAGLLMMVTAAVHDGGADACSSKTLQFVA